MRITISVSGRSGTGDNTVQCGAAFDVPTIDQDALQQMTHAARQCAATIAAVAGSPSGQPTGPASNNQPQTHNSKRLATEKQVKAIRAMAGRMGIELASVLHDRFGVSGPSGLSIREASSLIDELKQSPVAS